MGKQISIMEALKNVTESISEWANEKLNNKVDKVSNKGLSTNDYTTADKNKVAKMANDLVVIENKLYLAQDGVPIEDSVVELPIVDDSGVDFKETDPTVPSWAKASTKPTYTASEVGALSVDTLSGAIDDALAQAKASGEFDGVDGTNGKDGKTPVKGTDYFTDADKTEIVNSVLEALPTWTGGSY